jgi:hypothetical protein
MNSQQTSQNEAAQAAERTQDAAESRPASGQSAEEAGAHGDAHEMTQAARSVMHPDRHDLEWRFYHGAAAGG